jgi:hypothetical protein
MKRVLSFIGIVAIIFSMTACKKDKEETCQLDTGQSSIDMVTDVVLKASNTGDGSFSKIKYTVGDSVVSVSSPSLPWEVTVSDVSANTNIGVVATGTVKNGSLHISYNAGADDNYISGSDMCSQSTD